MFLNLFLLVMFRLSAKFRRIGAVAIGGACLSQANATSFLQQSVCASHHSTNCSVGVLDNYSELRKKMNDIENLNGVNGLLGWDEMVMLAPGSADARGNQKAVVAKLLHGEGIPMQQFH